MNAVAMSGTPGSMPVRGFCNDSYVLLVQPMERGAAPRSSADGV